MSTSAMRSAMKSMEKENPQGIFNVRKIADESGLTVASAKKTVQEWIDQGWARIHPETDQEIYEFVLTPEGIKELF